MSNSERAFRERDAMLMRGDMDDEKQMGRQEDGCDDDDSDSTGSNATTSDWRVCNPAHRER
jgi:hypothetical protein